MIPNFKRQGKIIVFLLRNRTVRKKEGQRFETFKEVLEKSRPGQEISWPKSCDIRVVDVDWHGSKKPPDKAIRKIVAQCPVTPCFWWISGGGGIHLVYERLRSLSAGDWSAISALYFLNKTDCTGVEILNHTASPPSKYMSQKQKGDLSYISRWLDSGGIDPNQIDEYLKRRGWWIGLRLPHIQCPFDPRSNAREDIPIKVQKDGMYCWVCGRLQPWSKILGVESVNRLKGFVKARVPWSNVEPYLKHIFGTRAKTSVLRSTYRVALIAEFGVGHPFINPVIYADPYLLRASGGQWLSSTTLEPQTDKLELAFRKLPCCQDALFDNEKKEWKVKNNSILLRNHIARKHKLKDWPEYRPQSGAPLYHFGNPPIDGVLRIERPDVRVPQYRVKTDRMNMEEAWAYIESQFPGVSRLYLETLLLLRGVAESGQVLAPILFVDGPSGAGKTITAKIAGEIIGGNSVIAMPHLKPSPDLIQRAIGEHLERGCDWLILDEFGKGLSINGQQRISNAVLITDKELIFTALYRGQVRVPFNAPIILTNTAIPEFFTQDHQIARRILYISLDHKVQDWRKTAGSVDGWRLRSKRNQEACETIYSFFADKFANLDLLSVLKSIKIPTVLEKFPPEENKALRAVKYFFELVCTLPAPKTGHWKGRKGWRTMPKGKVVLAEGERPTPAQELALAWYHIRDQETPYSIPRAISGLDLAKEFKLKCPAELKIEPHGNQIAFRFVSKGVPPQSKKFLVNRKLFIDPDSLPKLSDLLDDSNSLPE